jgi:hypothetical protein
MLTDATGPNAPIADAVLDRLLSAASYHVRAAQAHADSSDSVEKHTSSIHAGAGIELAAKALLAQLDRRLLRDRQDAQHALLDVIAENAGVIDRETAPKASLRTLEAAIAVDLACRISPAVRPYKKGALRALKARNAAAHFAEIDEDLERGVDDAVLFVAAALNSLV